MTKTESKKPTASKSDPAKEILDIFVIGAGVNGAAIARDAAGRGLSVALVDKGDIASQTSSKSTKLFHGGLRYLEYFELRLVRQSLREREILLQNMPHISWPMRFVLPIDPGMRFDTTTPVGRVLRVFMPWLNGRRPAWIIRAALGLYDSIGGRKILPKTATLNLRDSPEGEPLKPHLHRAFEYSDCWVDDARLVVLMAVDVAARGGLVMTRTRVVGARRDGDVWQIKTEGAGGAQTHYARALVNAAGCWVDKILNSAIGDKGDILRGGRRARLRLVKGSHIIVNRLYRHDKCYFFQGSDGRIVFAIPYLRDFTLIGTTEAAFNNPNAPVECSEAEMDYLCERASAYFKKPLVRGDIVAHYAGLRALYDDSAKSATASSRDYVLEFDGKGAPPIVSVFGGKITTHRRLAEAVLRRLKPCFGGRMGSAWTERAPLLGGDFAPCGRPALLVKLREDYPFLDEAWGERLFSAYGLAAWDMLGNSRKKTELGADFGATLTAREVDYLITREFAQTTEDILWRRSKIGLTLAKEGEQALSNYLKTHKIKGD